MRPRYLRSEAVASALRPDRYESRGTNGHVPLSNECARSLDLGLDLALIVIICGGGSLHRRCHRRQNICVEMRQRCAPDVRGSTRGQSERLSCQCLGVAPVARRNVFVKWLWSAKPVWIAINAMDSLPSNRSSCARLIRASRNHLYGAMPVEFLNDRANCDWESPTSLAISSRLMSCVRWASRYSIARRNCHRESPFARCVWAFPRVNRAAVNAVVRPSP